MTEQQIAGIVTNALGPNAPISLEQLSALLMALAISVILLAMGMGYQIVRSERRISALESALNRTEREREAM